MYLAYNHSTILLNTTNTNNNTNIDVYLNVAKAPKGVEIPLRKLVDSTFHFRRVTYVPTQYLAIKIPTLLISKGKITALMERHYNGR